MCRSVRRLTLVLTLPLLALALLAGQALADSAPTNTLPPTVATLSGLQPSPGQTLIASPGTWTGSPAPTFSYEWYECDYNGLNCVDTGQSGDTYTLANSDYANDLEALVTASNTAGNVSLMSAPVYVMSSGPTLLHPPKISGGTQVGDVLRASTGDWTGYPTPQVYDYTWWDCNRSGADCQPNPQSGGINSTYTLTAADVGHRIEVTVYVDNGNHASGTSALTRVIAAPRPGHHHALIRR